MTIIDDKLACLRKGRLMKLFSEAIHAGSSIPFSHVLEACGGSLTGFPSQGPGPQKCDYCIYQHAVFLEHPSKGVAVFHRHKLSKDRERITRGRSILVAESTIEPPWNAIPSLMARKISWGRKDQLTNIQPYALALNDLPHKNDQPQPAYCMAIYRYVVESNRVNGLVRDYPDTFLGWAKPKELRDTKVLDGFLDRLIVDSLVTQDPSKHFFCLDGNPILSLSARLTDVDGSTPHCKRVEVSASRSAFFSHAGDDWVLAQLLAVALTRASEGSVFPVVDSLHVKHGGEHWPQIESQVANADCMVVLITGKTEYSEGCKREVEFAKTLKPPMSIIPVLINVDPPDSLTKWWAFDLRQYRNLEGEISKLVDHILDCPFRPDS